MKLSNPTLLKWLPQLMLQQVLCSAIEKVVNKALSLNINDNSQLIALEQKTLAVKLGELGFPLCFSVNNGKILVTKLIERANCTIITSINTLKTLQKEQQLTQLIKNNQLDIEGDLKVAQQFASIAENLDIDWQSEIAKHIGDVPTYKLGQAAKTIRKKVTFAAEQIQADASEWLVHEQHLAVTKSQLSDFNRQVSETSDHVNNLEKRIEQLTQHFSLSHNTQG
jgi:ubiquinone biosynthesis protein UbiJ